MDTSTAHGIFSIKESSFFDVMINVFNYQVENNSVYREWCNLYQKSNENNNRNIQNIPFLPVSFFKNHNISSQNDQHQGVFMSSGTTQTVTSKHLVWDLKLYEQSFLQSFQLFYGNPKDWCIIGLLPSYLERSNSSLVYMVDILIKKSTHPESGFYLYDMEKLASVLQGLEENKQPTWLIGVTYALLDFAEAYPMKLLHTTIIDTGGMKGRKKEITKNQLHEILTSSFGVKTIHSEYGMTELLSQAYSTGDGRFRCPPWMKVFVRDEDDPFLVSDEGKGLLNIVDLANIYSCSFLATDDIATVYKDGSFEIWGRLDNSDLRGCSLLYL